MGAACGLKRRKLRAEMNGASRSRRRVRRLCECEWWRGFEGLGTFDGRRESFPALAPEDVHDEELAAGHSAEHVGVVFEVALAVEVRLELDRAEGRHLGYGRVSLERERTRERERDVLGVRVRGSVGARCCCFSW